MNWDIFLFIANMFLTVGIIPQLFKNYKTKNVESHCVFWHLSTITGMILLVIFYGYELNLFITTVGLFATVVFRVIIICQIFKYSKPKQKDSLTELWYIPEDNRWNPT